MDTAGAAVFQCVRCGNPAPLVCKGCKTEHPVSGDLMATTRYCGKFCQKEHWRHHKAFCKATKGFREIRSLKSDFQESPAKEVQPLRVKTPELQTHEPQLHEAPARETQAHEIQGSTLSPYEVHPHQASTSGGHEAHQTAQTVTQPKEIHSCASCKNPATDACKACKAAPNGFDEGLVEAVYYCSLACQTTHWSEHKEACLAAQARRNLYEAGKALRKTYRGYCQGLIVLMLASKTLNANHMILYEKDSVQRTTNAMALLLETSTNAEETEAYFSCLVGSDLSGRLADRVKERLKGKQRPQPVAELSRTTILMYLLYIARPIH